MIDEEVTHEIELMEKLFDQKLLEMQQRLTVRIVAANLAAASLLKVSTFLPTNLDRAGAGATLLVCCAYLLKSLGFVASSKI